MEENLTGILTNRKDADDACRGVGRATVEVGHLNLSASNRRERERGALSNLLLLLRGDESGSSVQGALKLKV